MRAALVYRVKRSLRKTVARMITMRGWRFPRIEAMPAPVRPRLRNIAP
jgi:hypothetical protein